MKAEWKDVTSYSRSNTERIPQSWRLEAGAFRLVVTRMHGLEGWYGNVDGLFRSVELASDLKASQGLLISLVANRLEVALEYLRQ